MNKTEEKIQIERTARFNERLSKTILSDPISLDLRYAKSDGEVSFESRTDLKYSPIEQGNEWGQRWEVAWFDCRVEIPESYFGHELAVRIDLGGEGLVYDDSGNMLQGISSGSVFDSEFSRDLIHLGALPANRRNLRLWIEASACGLFGVHTEPDPLPTSPRRYGHFEAKVKTAELCRFDRERWSLWLDLETIRGVLTALPEASTRRSRLLVALAEALDLYGRTGSVTECRKLLAEEYNRPASDSELTSVAVGHAHIDTAWLWPVRESVRKCARTFASQLSLIDKYPDYVFGASQPQHYKFVKEHYPALYERISRAVNDGRWEVQGGMWVEADCNLISGESMIRQILHGKNFFRDEFGVDVNNLWLPDVFGYSPALPQILLKSGIQYFLTQKMSWNQYNKFPHHTFEWQGIDGSSVLAHFPPEDTYNSSLRAESLIRGAAQFRERGYLDRFMSLFGVGDGGGGPKEEHLEFGKRCKDVEGVPHVRFDKAESFFAEVEKDREKLPTWVGELYLELHRGTLTTQAQNKRWNRKLEYRIQDAEMLFSCLSLEDYPDSQLSGLWQTLLMNQFHDILPGSSITSVYSRSAEEYEQINGELDQLQAQAVGKMAEPDEDALLLFNPTSYRFEGTIALPSGWTSATAASSPAAPVSAQLEQSGVRAAVTVEPFEFITLKRSPEPCKDVIEDEGLLLENDLIRCEFDPDGRLLKVLDKEIGRFVSQADNPGNLLTLYEDRPNNWDAWDIDRTYERTAVASAVSEAPARRLRGPVRQTLQLQLGIGNTHIKQQIVLSHGSKRLDFQTAVDWQESHKMLRVAFPVNVRSDEASFDIQCGYVKRPTHRNTSWDLARFEVVAHRYADVSEPDYGVALLNDCKYGHRVLGSTLDLCLLRSPSYPDPDADRGAHEFTYALLPHQSDMVRSDVMAQASALNHPPLVRHGFGEHDTRVPVRIEGTGVVIQTLKKAEKESCLVLRLVETNGCRTTAALRCASDIIRVEECDLMEWNVIRDIRLSNNESITLDPFEVKTFKLWRK